MAKKLTKAQKLKNAKTREREKLSKEYSRLYAQTKNQFYSVGGGFYDVTFEQFMKTVGTSSEFLKAPTKRSVEKLKKAQSKEQVLKALRTTVLTKGRYGSKERAKKLESLNERIKESKQEEPETTDKFKREIIKKYSRFIGLFIGGLENVIYKYSSRYSLGDSRKLTNVNRYVKEVVRNASTMKGKLTGSRDSLIADIENLERGSEGFNEALSDFVSLSDNCKAYIEENGQVDEEDLYGVKYVLLSHDIFSNMNSFFGFS